MLSLSSGFIIKRITLLVIFEVLDSKHGNYNIKGTGGILGTNIFQKQKGISMELAQHFIGGKVDLELRRG